MSRSLAFRHSTRLNDQCARRVATREVIGAAKGILLEAQGCNRDEAFDMLRRASQRANRKLRDLAEELVARLEARAGKGRSGKMTAPPHAVPEAARTEAGMSFQELWIAYLSLGGSARFDVVRAYLAGQAAQSIDYDVLAQAISERW